MSIWNLELTWVGNILTMVLYREEAHAVGVYEQVKQALQDIVVPELKALQGEIKSVRVEITSETWKTISLTTPPVKQSQTTMCLFRTLFIK